MDKIRIIGGQPLKGKIRIGGAKNACLPLMAASLLTQNPLILRNVPDLADITSMAVLLRHFGVEVTQQDSEDFNYQSEVLFHANTLTTSTAPNDLVRKMRASILALGPLLARTGEASLPLPGGCAIGTRPIDLHIKGLQQLGAEITVENGYVHAVVPKRLKGTEIIFPLISVTGTENLMMAACLADGQTKLINAAREPEISDLAHCLNAMGAKISGIGTDTLTIEGVESLQGTTYTVMPDRIETGTYIMAAAITKGTLELIGASTALIPTVVEHLEQVGVNIKDSPTGIHVSVEDALTGVDMITEPFPGFPTDLQAQFMALMTVAQGASMVTETIFENRFMHIPELQRLGASINVHGSSAIIRGVKQLTGTSVTATDLRASVSLVLAGLVAQGETVIEQVYHLDRGYEQLENKLAQCGVAIERIKGESLGYEDKYAA